MTRDKVIKRIHQINTIISQGAYTDQDELNNLISYRDALKELI